MMVVAGAMVVGSVGVGGRGGGWWVAGVENLRMGGKGGGGEWDEGGGRWESGGGKGRRKGVGLGGMVWCGDILLIAK